MSGSLKLAAKSIVVLALFCVTVTSAMAVATTGAWLSWAVPAPGDAVRFGKSAAVVVDRNWLSEIDVGARPRKPTFWPTACPTATPTPDIPVNAAPPPRRPGAEPEETL